MSSSFIHSFLLSLALCGSAAAQDNVLLVIADDLGTDRLAAYGEGSQVPSTPTLDAIAAGGVLFRNCWANPVCSTTRATILTGRYSFRTGVGSAIPASPSLPFAERTIPEALDELGSGHDTALVGKWHLGGHTQGILGMLNPNFQGFDHFAGAIAGAFVGPYDYERWPRTEDGMTSLSRDYATSVNVDDALSWLENRSTPWFLTVSFNAPHTPFHAPPHALHSQSLPGVAPCEDPIPFHDAMVEALDTELGRLLAGLDPAVRVRTTLIFVGDNGTTPAVAQAPLDPAKGKGSLYQGGIRVPLLVAGTAVNTPGRENVDLVNTSDLFATVLELCGADPGQLSGGPPGDSRSLLPLLSSPAASPARDYAYAEIFADDGGQPNPSGLGRNARVAPPFESLTLNGIETVVPPVSGSPACLQTGAAPSRGRTLRDERYKLILFEDGSEELYDLLLDPLEETELLSRPLIPTNAVIAYLDLLAQLDLLLGS